MADAAGGLQVNTVDGVYRDLQGRRAGLIKALTTDLGKLYDMCDPNKKNLSLYGYPDETWQVNVPGDDIPPEIPEPVLGINFARDGMSDREWRTLVAVHSDLWLLSVAFYFAGRLGFNKAQRRRLFIMINDLPTILDVVSGKAKKQKKKKPSASNHRSNKSNSNSKRESRRKHPKTPPPQPKFEDDEGLEEEGVDDEHDDDTLCGACEQSYSSDEFWICCDVCDKWFHGTCVNITPAQAEYIKQYKCPLCSSSKRARP